MESAYCWACVSDDGKESRLYETKELATEWKREGERVAFVEIREVVIETTRD